MCGNDQSEDGVDPKPMRAAAKEIDYEAVWKSSGIKLDKLVKEMDQLRQHIKSTNVWVDAVFELANLALAEIELLSDEPHKALKHFRSLSKSVLATTKAIHLSVLADAIELAKKQ